MAMPQPWDKLGEDMRVTTAETTRAPEKATIWLLCLTAWLIPGAGHFWLRRPQKGAVFLAVLPLMFAVGLMLEGRMFPFEASQPLVALAAVADFGIGLFYFLAWAIGWGHGTVVSVTYEYGNTFLIVAGLLNLLVVIDAYDIALGRK
jgi:hypothetical protein